MEEVLKKKCGFISMAHFGKRASCFIKNIYTMQKQHEEKDIEPEIKKKELLKE